MYHTNTSPHSILLLCYTVTDKKNYHKYITQYFLVIRNCALAALLPNGP